MCLVLYHVRLFKWNGIHDKQLSPKNDDNMHLHFFSLHFWTWSTQNWMEFLDCHKWMNEWIYNEAIQPFYITESLSMRHLIIRMNEEKNPNWSFDLEFATRKKNRGFFPKSVLLYNRLKNKGLRKKRIFILFFSAFKSLTYAQFLYSSKNLYGLRFPNAKYNLQFYICQWWYSPPFFSSKFYQNCHCLFTLDIELSYANIDNYFIDFLIMCVFFFSLDVRCTFLKY